MMEAENKYNDVEECQSGSLKSRRKNLYIYVFLSLGSHGARKNFLFILWLICELMSLMIISGRKNEIGLIPFL